MKSVRMTNNTSKTLTAYNIPLQDNGSMKVEPGHSVIVGIYSITHSKDYAAMVKSGFTMDFVDDSTNNVAVSQSTDTVVKDKKESVPEQPKSDKDNKTIESASTIVDTQDDAKTVDDRKDTHKRGRKSSKTNDVSSPENEKASEE